MIARLLDGPLPPFFVNGCPRVFTDGGVAGLSMVGLVGLHDLPLAAKRREDAVPHRFPNAVCHEPSGLKGDAQGAVKLVGSEMPFLLEVSR